MFADKNAPSGIEDLLFFRAVPFIAKDEHGEVKPYAAEAYPDYQALTLEERSEIAKSLTDLVVEFLGLLVRDAWRKSSMQAPKRSTKVGRNGLCACGSGKKLKRRCAIEASDRVPHGLVLAVAER